jgi:hypothetical protein
VAAGVRWDVPLIGHDVWSFFSYVMYKIYFQSQRKQAACMSDFNVLPQRKRDLSSLVFYAA